MIILLLIRWFFKVQFGSALAAEKCVEKLNGTSSMGLIMSVVLDNHGRGTMRVGGKLRLGDNQGRGDNHGRGRLFVL